MVAVLGLTWLHEAGRRGCRALPAPVAAAVMLGCVLAVLTTLLGAARSVPVPPPPVAALVLAPVAAAGPTCGPGWGTGWLTAPRAAPADPALDATTLRLIVQPQLAGSQVRIRLSNAYGTAPLEIGAASVARSVGGAGVDAASLRAVGFGGQPRVVVPAGADVVSDPVALATEVGTAVAVSVYLPVAPQIGTVQPAALQTSYLSGRGDHALESGGSAFDRRIGSWPVLTGLDVLTPHPVNAVVTIGDSITDGVGSDPDADERWSDVLSRRLADTGGAARMAVLNAGIAGNQLLADDPRRIGAAPLARFDRDVAAAGRATDVVLNIGTNDLAGGRSADEITGGLQQFAAHARAAGKRVFLTTITPSVSEGRGTPAAIAVRTAVNGWLRAHGTEYADGVFDFAAVVADPDAPSRLAAQYDSGDGLHLSAAGYRALAGAVDPGVLTGSPCLADDGTGTSLLLLGR